MMQRILAIGGGGFSMGERGSPIDTYICELTGKERPQVCLIATPSGDHPRLVRDFHDVYGALGCETSNLAFFNQFGPNPISRTNYRTRLLQQDAIFVCGGDAKSAIGVWKEWGLDAVLREAWQGGVLLTGMSAGAICWFEHGAPDSALAGAQAGRFLGFLEGGCEVHYHAGETRQIRRNLLERFKGGGFSSMVAIDDYAAVLYAGQTIEAVLSWQPDATAYQIECIDGYVTEQPLAYARLAVPKSRSQPLTTSVPPAVLQTYVGRYRLMSPDVLTISMVGNCLFAELIGHDRFEMHAENERDFFCEFIDARVTFQEDFSGRVTSLTLRQNGSDISALKITGNEDL
jgi:dipeptidase E